MVGKPIDQNNRKTENIQVISLDKKTNIYIHKLIFLKNKLKLNVMKLKLFFKNYRIVFLFFVF